MNGTIKLVAPLVAALAVAACNAGGSSNVPGTTGQNVQAQAPVSRIGSPSIRRRGPVQKSARPGLAHCEVLIQNGGPSSPNVAGWAPVDFQTRYNLPSSTKGAGQIVAIVDAYDNPNVHHRPRGVSLELRPRHGQLHQVQSERPDRATIRRVARAGASRSTSTSRWSRPVCPKCTIYLIEANSSSTSDLETAETEAVTLGAHIVSNSWICYGSVNCDNPIEVQHPGRHVSRRVGRQRLQRQRCAGGSRQRRLGRRHGAFEERHRPTAKRSGTAPARAAQPGITKPTWQHDPGCTSRTDADVSADCLATRPNTTPTASGWFTVGGTSVASPLIGGVFGLAGNASSQHAAKQFWTLTQEAKPRRLHDITHRQRRLVRRQLPLHRGTHQLTYSARPAGARPNGLGAF